MKLLSIALCLCAFAWAGNASAEPKRVQVFVALADNASQGIAPVPAKIGNGDDDDNNLYWGNSEGFKGIFTRSKVWKLEKAEPNPTPEILDRRTYRHASKDCVLVAEAWGPLEAVDLERAETVLVWRQNGAVRQRLLTGGELALLAALATHQPLAEAVDAAGRRDPAFDFSAGLARFLNEALLRRTVGEDGRDAGD